jgi:hypothetical protein
MKSVSSLIVERLSVAIIVVVVLAMLSVASPRASGQATDEGQNAICITSPCTGSGIIPSPAFIDASVFCPSGGCSSGPTTDFCHAVSAALGKLPAAGGVVDARGINPGGANSCATNPFTVSNSTILLPSGTITISGTWILADKTRLVGIGNNGSGDTTGTNNGTEISVPTSGFSGASMIEMGPSSCNELSSGQCFGISVENLFLSGGGSTYPTLIGILNRYAGNGSYVDHVNFATIAGTGLVIGGNATDSGPYSNLTMAPATSCSSSTTTPTACVHFGDSTYGTPSSTRGIHGLTCTCVGSKASGGTGPVGVALNSSNNTLEDMHFEGFHDGIQVGGTATGNTLLNINGGNNNVDTMTNLIHICASSSTTCVSSTNSVSDLTVSQAYSGPYGGSAPAIIQDDITTTTIPSPSPSSTVGLYVLGDQMTSTGGGYSRFATNPVAGPLSPVPTWGVAAYTPNTSTSCQSGSLFSNTNGQTNGGGGTLTNYTFWICSAGGWIPIKH